MKNILISYSKFNSELVDALTLFLNNVGFNIINDTTQSIRHGHSIVDFIEKVKTTDFVLILISDNYLKSKNCIYEINHFLRDKNYTKKIIPIIHESASKIFNESNSLEYVKYWNIQKNKIKKLIDNNDKNRNLISEYNEIKIIENFIIKFMSLLRDYNLPLVNENNISETINQIINYIESEIYYDDCKFDNELEMLVNYTQDMISNNLYYQYDINNGFNLNSNRIIIPNKEIIIPQKTINTIKVVNESILEQVNKSPSIIHEFTPRKFEEFVCDLIEHYGYKVKLTQQTRDGGKDLIIAENRLLGNFLFYVECKKYRQDRSIGVKLVRELYGVISADRATAGMLVTSSYFSKDAIEYKEKIKHQMSFMDYQELVKNVQQIYQ